MNKVLIVDDDKVIRLSLYVQYLKRPHASIYIDAEREARAKRLGLWNDINPTPPWEWRRRGK